MTRRFGPTRGAGVVIIEEEAQKLLTPAALGVTGHVGIYEKGPVGLLVRSKTPTEFKSMRGSYVKEGVAPDAAFDFYEHGGGAGELHTKRITDGTERVSSLNVRSRQNAFRQEVIKLTAGFLNNDNPGRWAGKRQVVVGQYTAVSATSLSTGKTLKKDEFKGGKLVLAELPGKSYDILGNDIAGVISLPADSTLAADLAASGGGNQTYALVLENGAKHLSVLFKDGLENPTTEWGMEIYENGVLVKEYENLSSDPASPRYFEGIVNDDGGNFWLKVEDLFNGAITSQIRPANFAGYSQSLTATVLSMKIAQLQQIVPVGSPLAVLEEALGASIVSDKVTLEVTAPGTRPTGNLLLSTNPANDTTLTIDFSALEGVVGTKVITFKTVVANPTSQVLIGGSAAATRDNLLAFLIAMDYAKGYIKYEAGAGDDIDVTGLDANDLLNAGTEFAQSAAHFTLTQMSGGVDQTWSYVSEKQPDLPATSIVTGKAFAAPNAWLMGGVLRSSANDDFLLGDKVELYIDPLPLNELAGGFLIPKESERRIKFQIISNTANSISVKAGSDMTADAVAGDKFVVQAAIQLGNGYDGIASISDQDYIDAWDTSDSLFNTLFGQNKGLVKLATPGVTATAVQKAGANYAEQKNYQYRYEVPANIVTDDAAEAYVNDTLGRNDFVVVSFPSFAYVVDPEGDGNLKLISQTGAIHGREALVAKNFDGFFKAAAGTDVTLPRIVKLPTGTRVLDEELLNPQGLNVIKKKEGNFILWGDRTVSIDPAFKFKHQREYLSHVEHILQENFDFIIFALNNRDTQELLNTTLTAFFLGEFAKGAFEGDTFEDAVLIKLDAENNTNLTRANGDLNAQIKLRIVNTVERFNISIGKAGIFEELAA